MAKEIVKKIGVSTMEKTLQAFLPEVMHKLDSLQNQVADLRKDMDAKFERTHELINELGLRLIKVETKVDTYRELVTSTSDKMDNFRERLVRVEVGQSNRRKRAS